MKDIINALLRLYMLPVLVFSTTMSICVPMYSNAYVQPSKLAYVQHYSLKMSLHVPRVYDNLDSFGYRRYQTQVVKGKLMIEYDADGNLNGISFQDLVNCSHKLQNGKNVTYSGFLDNKKPLKIVAIGSNKTEKFNVASICFSIKAEPSYSIGELDEDTSLYVTLAGKGTIRNGKIYAANGTVAGTLGCGCFAYGHTSPTRLVWLWGVSTYVDDVAAVYGRWSMKLIK